eukprot:gene17461-biopygen21881
MRSRAKSFGDLVCTSTPRCFPPRSAALRHPTDPARVSAGQYENPANQAPAKHPKREIPWCSHSYFLAPQRANYVEVLLPSRGRGTVRSPKKAGISQIPAPAFVRAIRLQFEPSEWFDCEVGVHVRRESWEGNHVPVYLELYSRIPSQPQSTRTRCSILLAVVPLGKQCHARNIGSVVTGNNALRQRKIAVGEGCERDTRDTPPQRVEAVILTPSVQYEVQKNPGRCQSPPAFFGAISCCTLRVCVFAYSACLHFKCNFFSVVPPPHLPVGSPRRSLSNLMGWPPEPGRCTWGNGKHVPLQPQMNAKLGSSGTQGRAHFLTFLADAPDPAPAPAQRGDPNFAIFVAEVAGSRANRWSGSPQNIRSGFQLRSTPTHNVFFIAPGGSGGDPVVDGKIGVQSLQKHHFWLGTSRNVQKWTQ